MNIAIAILFFCTCGLIGLFILLVQLEKQETIEVEKYLNLYKVEIEKQKTMLQKGNLKKNLIERKIKNCKRKLNLK